MKDVRNRFAINDVRVLNLIEGCTKDMISWGYTLPKTITWYSANCKNRLGLANYSKNSITLSSFLFKETKDDNIKNTIYHELAHLAAGPRVHHGPKWQAIAKNITAKTGIKITRLADTSEYEYFKSEENQNKYKYIFKCSHCGAMVKLQKRTKFVNTYAHTYTDLQGKERPRWTCTRCGHAFIRVK